MMGSFFGDVASLSIFKTVEKFQNRFFTEHLRLTSTKYFRRLVQSIKMKSRTSLRQVNVLGKYPNTEFVLVRFSLIKTENWNLHCNCPYSVGIHENTDQKKFRIRFFFTRCNILE